MIPWVYIVAYDTAEPGALPMLAFKYMYVMAKDERDAYKHGQERLTATQGWPQRAYNDLVVPIGQSQ